MSKTERKEYVSSKVVRTLSPSRTLSNQNLTEFDNNLDHLLDDLQNSVSRPGSSLGNTHKETYTTFSSGKTDSLGRVKHLSAANPTTIISDESYTSYKPGETVKTVKTYKENYSSYNVNTDISPEKARMQNNINKLDTLLDDLQQVRQGTLDKGISDVGIDPGLLESPVGGNKQVMSKKTVHRELLYDSNSPRGKREESIEREIIVNDGTYGDIRKVRQSSPTRSTLKNSKVETYNYKTETRNALSPKTEIIETVNPDINPNVLAQLDPTLLPPPNTKVTTTIKTYTYEIPGTGYPSTVSPLNETVFSSNPSTPSQSFAYNKVENSSSNYSANYVRPVSPNPSGYSSKHVENISTTKNLTDSYPTLGFTSTPTSAKKTYVYNETTTTKNINSDIPRSGIPRSPPAKEKQVHIYNETTTNVNDYSSNRYQNEPKTPGTTHHINVINESNTRNVNSYPGNGYPPSNNQTTVIYKHDTHTTRNYGPYGDNYDPNKMPPYGNKPDKDVNITYKYTTHTTSSNRYRGHPNDESEPLLHPMPFPNDSNTIDGPPKKLDQLMAELGNEPPDNAYNAGYNAKQAELAHKREVERITDSNQKKVEIKDLPKTKNIAGPPVYYPPGHELFLHKEESGAYRAEGGMMKESGKYKYEAQSKSKSKSSSGVAVVPVCLPLCCGLPCVIM